MQAIAHQFCEAKDVPAGIFICTKQTFQSLEKISAFTVNLTYNLEPIYSIILAMILFGEAKDLGLSFYIGLAFIALSVGLQTWSVMRIQKRVAALDKLTAEDSDKKPHPVFIEPIGSRKERE